MYVKCSKIILVNVNVHRKFPTKRNKCNTLNKYCTYNMVVVLGVNCETIGVATHTIPIQLELELIVTLSIHIHI